MLVSGAVRADVLARFKTKTRYLDLMMRRLRNSASRFAPVQGNRPVRLIFDPLETRLLMSADVLAVDLATALPQNRDHDAVVRLVQETRMVEERSVAVQRVEVVDRTSAVVIASADLDILSRIAITGGSGDDRLTIDAASFEGHEAPIFSFFGGDGADSLFLASNEDAVWSLAADGSGTVRGAFSGAFEHVETLGGGAGADTLEGSHVHTGWLVDGEGSGRVGATFFSGFENLVGAADSDDTFTFTATGTLKGFIHGGDRGFDSLVLDVGSAHSVTSIATGPDSGSISVDGSLVTYRGLEPITLAGTMVDLSFDISALAAAGSSGGGYNIVRLADYGTATDGRMILDSVNGTFEDQIFSAPTGSLTIKAGSGADDIEIVSLDSTFAVSLTIDALLADYDPFGQQGLLSGLWFEKSRDSVIRVSGDLNLKGASLNLVADTVYFGTVAEQTDASGGVWAANRTFTAVAASGGTGSGATATIETDGDGNATARLAAAGRGYKTGDTLTFADPTGGGRSVTLTLRNAADSAVVSTSVDGGSAGSITVGRERTNADGVSTYAGGKKIGAGPNASLIAAADTASGHKAGKIVLVTSDITNRQLSWPGAFTSKSAAIDIVGTTIRGGSTKISATAKDANLSSDIPTTVASDLISKYLVPALNQAPGVIVGAITGVNLSAILRGADASIDIDDATIDVIGGLDIKSTTKVETIVNVLASPIGGGLLANYTGLEFAAGYGMARSTVAAKIGGSTTINATDSVTIQADGAVSGKTTATAKSNTDKLTGNPKGVSAAIAIAHTDLSTHATVGSGVSITSTGGNVNVLAKGSVKTTPDASTVSPIDGKAGVASAVGVSFADVKANVDGTIIATGSFIDSTTNDQTFGGDAVDVSGNTLHIPDHGYTTGDQVKYTPYSAYSAPVEGVSAGTAEAGDQQQAVGGLDKDAIYSVIVVDKDHIQLAKMPSLALDASDVDDASTQSLTHVDTRLFDLGAIDAAADSIAAAEHGFQGGDTVRYSAGGNSAIAGLTDGASYRVEYVDDATFKLKDGNGGVIDIAQGPALGHHTFTREADGQKAELTLARLDTANGRIVLPGHGFAPGSTTEVIYQSLAEDGANAIGGLANEGTYNLYAVDANSFELRDPATGQRVALTEPGSSAVHALAFISTVLNFKPSTAVDASRGTIEVDPAELAKLSDGDAVIYSIDPTISKTRSVVFNLNVIDEAADTITVAGNGFANGAVVTYDAGGMAPITGLVDGASYTVVKANEADDAFQLRDGTGVIVQLQQGSALGVHTFTDAANQLTAVINLARVDAENNRIHLAGHGFTATAANPLLVDYSALLGAAIGGLVNAGDGTQRLGQYHLVVIDADTFELRDATTGEIVDLTGISAAGLHVIADEQLYRASRGSIGGVTQSDAEISGLQSAQTYYIVKVDDRHIRLVEDPSQISSVKPIDFTDQGNNAAQHGLRGVSPVTAGGAVSSNAMGIGVQAKLDSSSTAKAKPQISKPKVKAVYYKDILSGKGAASHGLGMYFGYQKFPTLFSPAKDQNGKDITSNITNNNYGLSAGGAVAVNVAINSVKASVGAGANAADPAVLRTSGNIEVLASNKETTQIVAQAEVSKSKTGNPAGDDKSVALAFAVSYYKNDINAVIESHAIIDAGKTVKVDADLSYPFRIEPADLVLGIPADFSSSGINFLKAKFLDGTFGVSSKLMNTWVMSRAKAADSTSTSVTGSIAVNIYENSTKAIIKSGAQINQAVPSATWVPLATQSVSVTAQTKMQVVEMAGIGKWSLNQGPLVKAYFEGKTASQLFSGGDIVDIFSRGGSKALGGSVLVDNIDNTVYARIEGGAAVGTGKEGKLTIAATEDILRVAIAQSGGKTDANSSFAFAGSGNALRQRSDVQAGLVADASGGPRVTGGDVVISAVTGGTQVAIAGGLVSGGTGSNGLGASVVVNDVERNVYAFIGADPDGIGGAQATPTGAVTLDVRNTSVSAKTSGAWVAVAGTGAMLSGPSGAPQVLSGSADDPLDGISLPALFEEGASVSGIRSGVGFAGSVGINVIRDTDLAYINARGSVRAETVSLLAENDATYVSVSGGVAVSVSAGTSLGGGTTIGGAFALNQITADTQAFIADRLPPSAGTDVNGLVVTSLAADAVDKDEISIKARRTGTLAAFSAGVGANTNILGNSYAGSISVNRLVDDTKAVIDGARVVAAGNVRQDARNEAQIIAIGGGTSYTAGARGIGASLGFNQLSARTEAGVIGTARRASLDLGGSFSATAVNDQNLWAAAVSLGVATGGGLGGTGAAFTLGINIISTDEKVFGRENASAIEALLRNADVKASGVSLEAKDNSVIYAIAGALGIGAQGSAYGVGLGWNQIALQVRATVDNANVESGAGGIILTAHSTQDGPIGVAGKIAAAAIGGASGNSTAVGGSVSVNGIYNTIETTVSGGSVLATTSGGDVSLAASDDSTINALTGGAAISSTGSAVGAALAGNYIANRVTARVSDSRVAANGSVKTAAHQGAGINSLAIGGAGGSGTAVAGSVSVNVVNNEVRAAIAGAAADVAAHGNVRVTADNVASIVTIPGSLAVGGRVGVGLSVSEITILDTTEASIDGAAKVYADGALDAFTDVLGATHRGVSIEAKAAENIISAAVGGALSGSGGAGSGAASFTYVDVTAKAYVTAPTAALAADDGITSGREVNVAAYGDLTLVGVAGALAGASGVGVGVGADAGYVKRNLEASIGAGARVHGEDNVGVIAVGDATLTSVSAAASIAGTGAGSLTAGVSVLDLTARAFIGADAAVSSDGNVLVSAEDTTELVQVSGNVAGAGTGAGGVAAGIGVVNKTVEAYIASNAVVTALAKDGKAGVLANTGAFGAPSAGTNTQQQGASASFKGSSVDYGGNTIHAVGHGLATGQEVVYTGESLALGGLRTGSHYYVIRIDGDRFALAATKQNADNGARIDLIDNGIDTGASHVVQTLADTGVPLIDNQAFNDPSIYNNRSRDPIKAAQTGLIVVAVSVNDLTSAGTGAAIAGTGAGSLAGALSIHTIDTRASIESGAKINGGAANATDAGAAQNVRVAAGRTYNGLAIGGGLAGSGTFSAAPAFAAPVLNGVTEAAIRGATSGSVYDTVVNAKGSVGVVATARTDIIDVAAGVAAAGVAGIAGSAAVVVIDTTTMASIAGNVRVAAGGNVLVSATDDTVTYAIGGAVGVGLAGGGGAGAVDVTSITKKTTAIIGERAIVDADGNASSVINVPDGTLAAGGTPGTQAIRGVAVLADSSEKVVSVAASLGGGFYAGIAGGVTVELLDSDTLAAIGAGAAVNQNTASSANAGQSVVVAATNAVDILTYAGGLGIGAAGVGASVDVGILRNDTQAHIGAASVRARDDVSVFSLSDWAVNTNAISAGAGVGGIGGGIVVYQVGGNFSDTYSTEGGSAGALNGNGGTSVLDFVNSTVNGLTARMQAQDNGAAAFDPAVAVSSAADTINVGADRGLKTGETLIYSSGGGQAIGGLEDGKGYYAIVNAADPTRIRLAATYEDAQAGRAIDINAATATGANHRLAGSGAEIANLARTGIGSSPAGRVSTAVNAIGNVTSGTTAGIQSGAAIVATDVAVKANQGLDFTARAGGAAAGLAGAIGVGVAVVNIDADTTAYIANGVSVTGLNPTAGTLTIDARLNADVHTLGFGGAVSGFVSLGGAVSFITDHSSARALLGAAPGNGDSSIIQASSASGRTVVTGFKTVSVTASAKIDHHLADGVAAVAGAAGLGAAVSSVTINGTAQAIVGNYTLVGTTNDTIGDGVSVEADRVVTVNPFDPGMPMGIAVGAGFLVGAAAGATIITVDGTVTARVGDEAEVHAAGDLRVKGRSTFTANDMVVDGGAIGAVAVGVVIARAKVRPTVEASFGANSVIRARRVDLDATNTVHASLKGQAAGGGLLSGQGLDVDLLVKPTTSVTIGAGADIRATEGVFVSSTANTATAAAGNAGNYGGAVIIVGKSTNTLENTNTAHIGAGSVIAGGKSVSVLASSTNNAISSGDGGGAALVTLLDSEANTRVIDETLVTIASNAAISAGIDLDVESRTSSTGAANPKTSGVGLGASTQAIGTLTYGGRTFTDIGANAQLTAGNAVRVLARVTKLDLTADASAVSEGAGAFAEAHATIGRPGSAPTSDAQVFVRNGAKLAGGTQVDVKARHESIRSMATSYVYAFAVIVDREAYSTNDFNVVTRVTADQGSQIRTFALTVEAYGVPSITGYTSSTAEGVGLNDLAGPLLELLGVPPTVEERSEQVHYQRGIDFNSNVFLFGSPPPELEIDANGNVTKRIGMGAPIITATDIILPDLVNNATLAGTATFSAAGDASIRGNANFTFLTAFDHITITNASEKNVRVGRIEPVATPQTYANSVRVDVSDKSQFHTATKTDLSPTAVTITNTSTRGRPGIVLSGEIRNALGSVTLSTAAGDIGAVAGGRIEANTLLLSAPGGVIGTASAPILTASGRLDARARDGIAISETGDLEIGSIVSDNGTVQLSATGSIRDADSAPAMLFAISSINGADSTAAATVKGPVIHLTANAGAIGAANNALRIDAGRAAGSLSAIARDDIALTDVSGGLGIATVSSTAGNIVIVTVDTAATGEDFVLGATSGITAGQGDIVLRAGDDILLAEGGRIEGVRSVDIVGDFGNADEGVGAVIHLEGTIIGGAIAVRGGADNDTVLIRRAAGSTASSSLLVSTEAGDDVVRVHPSVSLPLVIRAGDGDDFVDVGTGADAASWWGTDLTAYWTFNETSGRTFADSAGNAQDAVYAGSRAALGQAGPSAASYGAGTAIRFSGSATDYATVAHDAEFQNAEGTVQFWFNANQSASGTQTIFAKDGFGNNAGDLNIGIVNGRASVTLETGTGTRTITGQNDLRGGWHHLAFSFGEEGMKLYIDGVLAGTDAYAGGLQHNRQTIAIGASNATRTGFATNGYAGLVDEVAVFGQALTGDQVRRLMLVGPQQLNAETKLSGTLADYTFDFVNGTLQVTDANRAPAHGADQYEGVERLLFGDGNTAYVLGAGSTNPTSLSADKVRELAGEGTLIVLGDDGQTLQLTGSWADLGVGAVGSTVFSLHQSGETLLLVQEGIETAMDERVVVPVAYWSFDGDSWSVADEAGARQNGTFYSNTQPSTTGAGAQSSLIGYDTGTSADFRPASGDVVAVAHDSAFEVASGTVQLWFQADTTSGKQTLFAKDGYGTGNGLTISLEGNRLTARLEGNGRVYTITANTTVARGNWYNVALTFGAGGLKLYQNGELVGSSTYTGGLTQNKHDILIGRSNETIWPGTFPNLGLSNPFDGRIDEVAFYGEALTAAQIKAVIKSGPLAAIDTSGLSARVNARALLGDGSDDWLVLGDNGVNGKSGTGAQLSYF